MPARGDLAPIPISPQTHIVEALSDMVRTGELDPCEYLMVESEFAAMSAAIGASAAGARAYTATASQGLLYMVEALYNASGLGLPIVMTVANRAIGAPINIWNDHSDSMSQRDSGWIQLYAESNQEALDLHIQAFRLAEELSLPVMVCMDGFILTHAFERVDVPAQEQVDAFLPPFEPRQVLDPADPVTIGAMVGPEAFTEVKYLMHAKQMQALDAIPQIARRVRERVRPRLRRAGPDLPDRGRRDDRRRARLGARHDRGRRRRAARAGREDRRRRRSSASGPTRSRRCARRSARAKRIVVLEKAFAVGAGGIVGQNVRLALSGLAADGLRRRRRARRPADHQALAARAVRRRARGPARAGPADLPRPRPRPRRARARAHAGGRPAGPHAENILRDIGTVAARSH